MVGSTTLDLPLGAVVSDCHCIAGRTWTSRAVAKHFPRQRIDRRFGARAFSGDLLPVGWHHSMGCRLLGNDAEHFGLHGVHLLRDAWQQATQGVAVEGGLEGVRSGDLLFFSDGEEGRITHVALAASSIRAVHVALGRGGHSLEMLDRRDEYVKGLLQRFKFARRIVAS